MIAKSTVITKIQSILPMISPEEFPEIYVYLSSLPGIDKAQKPDDLPMPFEIANSILSMDRPGELPKDLVDIITDLFENIRLFHGAILIPDHDMLDHRFKRQ